MRPDELVMRESVHRQLGMKDHIMEMMIWGYVDPITGKDIVVTDEVSCSTLSSLSSLIFLSS